MPSVMTLEGPRLAALPEPTNKRIALFAVGSAALLGVAYLFLRHDRKLRRGLRGPEMLKIIASESRTAEEFARRADAWNAAERDPLPAAKLAKAYRKAKPAKMVKLLREAREAREESRERLWSRMSKGLRGRLGALPKDVAAIAKKLNAKVNEAERAYRDDVMPKVWAGDIGPEELARLKAQRDAIVDEADEILIPLTHPRPSKKALDAARAYAKTKGLRGRRGLDGYKIAFLDRGRRDVTPHSFDDLPTAIREMKLWKRRGFTTWVEDDAGNFVPVKGAMKRPRSL